MPKLSTALLITALLGGCNAPTNSLSPDKGKLLQKSTEHGEYMQYVSKNLHDNPDILVVVHGSIGPGHPAIDLADKFIRRWTDTADKENLILVAPAFDSTNYQTNGGYRGLIGRNIGADEFVNGIVDEISSEYENLNGQFYLYGHSAGGQFTIRYCVTHPERIIKAVASAPGRFAYPSSRATWPYGTRKYERRLKFRNPRETKLITIQPNPQDWIEAATRPITVVVGAMDQDPQPARDAHVGTTRIDLAFSWAGAMNQLAERSGKNGNILVKIVPGIGHNSHKLTPHCIEVLFGN